MRSLRTTIFSVIHLAVHVSKNKQRWHRWHYWRWTSPTYKLGNSRTLWMARLKNQEDVIYRKSRLCLKRSFKKKKYIYIYIYTHSTWNSHCTATRPVSVGPKCEGHDACRTLWTAQCGWSGRWRWPEAREAELGPGGPYAMVQIKFCMNGFLTLMVQMTLPPSSTLYSPIWRKPPSLLHLLFCTDTS